MKVGELITALQAEDPEMEVLFSSPFKEYINGPMTVVNNFLVIELDDPETWDEQTWK